MRKRWIRFLLLLFVFFFVGNDSLADLNTQGEKEGISAAAENGVITIAKQAATSAKKNVTKNTDTKVIAYYFHGTYRCYTCTKIEKYSREAIEMYFPDDLKSGKIEFRSVNVDEPASKHFIQDYQLHTRSLVLALYHGHQQQKWKNLKDVWQLVRDQDRFYQYVKSETTQFLEEAK